MSVYITSRLFYNRFTGTGGGGTKYLPVGITGICKCITECYIAWNLTDVRLQFTASDDSIAMLNDADGRTFIEQGFQEGDDITIVDTVSNNGNFTISSISSDGRTLYVDSAVTDETANSCSVHGVTPVDTIDYLYNLIENDEAETYFSKVDPETQCRYTAEGVDASDTLHEVNFKVLTKSRAWCTSQLSDETTGETSTTTIIGAGITEYRQYFTIEHNFVVSPFYTADQYTNFAERIAPEYYKGENALKYISRIEARFVANTPEPDHYGTSTDDNGVGSWFDQANFGRRPEYYVSGIGYQVNGIDVDELDVNLNTDVTITFKSYTGLFSAGSGRFILNFFVCPSDPSDYQNNGSTMLQNFFFDYASAIEGAPAVNGIWFGTAYQAIVDCTFVRVDANTLTASFTFSAGSGLAAFWEGKEDNDRYYAISLYTEDPAITTTKATNSVPCLADFNTAAWDKTDDTLFEFSGSGLYWYPYPDNGVYGVGDANLLEGDMGFWGIPFRIYNTPDADGNTPTVKSITVQIMAVKAGYNDFILEEKVIDCEGFRKLDDIQQLSVDETRGFITYEDDPRNAVTLVRDSGEDTGTMAAYILSYGMVARYEDWIAAYDSRSLNSEGVNSIPDVAKQIENVTQRWSNYSGINGWDLQFKVTVIVTGTDGNDNEYYSTGDITVQTYDQIDWTGIGGGATQELQFFTEDGATEINCWAKMATTLVRCTWTGDFPEPTNASGYYGAMIAVRASGSIFDQRFASTEIESEDSSPWSAPAADPDATTSYANGNLRINIYETLGTVTSIVVEGYFDSTIYGDISENILFIPRLGPKYVGT